MSVSQFKILEQDLADALSQVELAELNQRRGYVDMVLEEYDNLDKETKSNLNPVSYLNKQLSNHTYLDLSLFNLVFAELINNKIKLNNEETNSNLVNCGINAINNWKNYRDKHEIGEKQYSRAIAARNKKTAKRLNDVKYGPLNNLVALILELYEPTIESLHRDGKEISQFNIARRISPQVEAENKQPDGTYLLGKADDPVVAIERRLYRAVAAGDLISTKVYKK
jgi:hypothetical protein